MRLIDADELLILEAAAYKKAQSKTNDKITRLLNEVVHKKLHMLVSDAPTAYNVDKVVEELDKTSSYYECDEQGREHVQMVDLVDAIDIVKRGGVE